MKKVLGCLAVVSSMLAVSVVAGEPFVLAFWQPGNDWACEIDLSGYYIDHQYIYSDLVRRDVAAKDATKRVELSITVERTDGKLTSGETRDEYVKHLDKELGDMMHFLQVKPEHVTAYEAGQMAAVTFDLAGSGKQAGFRVTWVMGFLAHDSTRMTVQLSCMEQRAGDKERFDKVLESVTIIEGYQPTSADYFMFGLQCYDDKEYGRAISFFEQCLALERETRALARDRWLVLVDELGMSYGLSGEHGKARSVFLYGLSVEPEYPNFHYNLACAFAEESQLDSALVYLADAYRYKANVIAGEELPDASKDLSFKRYWKSDEFKTLMSEVKSMGK